MSPSSSRMGSSPTTVNSTIFPNGLRPGVDARHPGRRTPDEQHNLPDARQGVKTAVPAPCSARILTTRRLEDTMTTLQATKIDELKSGFGGEVLLPKGEAYERARQIWNAMIDKRPALIVRCAAVSDVVRAVNFDTHQA